MDPLVSIIVPTHNRPDLLVRALASIADQTVAHLVEAVVVDDGSDEPCDWVLELPMRLQYVRHDTPRDLAGARNAGLAVAKGTYVGYLDDDDVFYPDHVEELLKPLQEQGARAAYSLAMERLERQVDGEWVPVARRLVHDHPEFDRRKLMVINLTPVNTVLHERALLEETGVFDETLAVTEDWDLWIRMRNVTAFAHVRRVTCEYTTRGAGQNMTYDRMRRFPETQELIYARYRHLIADDAELLRTQEAVLAQTYANAKAIAAQHAATRPAA